MIKVIKKTKRSNETKDSALKIVEIGEDCFGTPKLKLPMMDSSLEMSDDPKLRQEFLLCKVEELMLCGVDQAATIARKLKIDRSTAKNYIARIQYRWSLGADASETENRRGQAISRLDLFTRELWSSHDSSTSESHKLRCLKSLIRLERLYDLVYGLSWESQEDSTAQSERPVSSRSEERQLTPDQKQYIAHVLKNYLSTSSDISD